MKKQPFLSKYKRAAIIRHYKYGASLLLIVELTGIDIKRVEMVINNYNKTKQQ